MCDTCVPAPPPLHVDGTEPEVFSDRAAILTAVQPGMNVLTADYELWAVVDEVVSGCCQAGVIVQVKDTGRKLRVPKSALVDVLDGEHLRVDRVRRTINYQGWDV
ncbi:hypothetical protein VRY54_09370 [Actinomyces sp. F1_1611]